MTSVRVGVVGLGFMGRVHAENARDLGHEVVGGVDVDAERREVFAREFDAPAYGDHEGLLAAEPVDAVVITTPNRYHEPAATAALDADLGVLVEKPMAHTVESAERIAHAAWRSEGCCVVGFHNRFSAAAVAARAHRDAGTLGELRHVDATFVRRRGVPSPGSWFTDPERAGGGALIDIGVHALDLALYMLGYPAVEEVSGVTRRDFVGRDGASADVGVGRAGDAPGVDDSARAFLRCRTGQTVTLDVAWASNRPPATEILVSGTEAGARLGDAFEGGETVELYETSDLDLDHEVTRELRGRAPDDGHRAELEQFLDAVAAGGSPPADTVAAGLAVQRVIDAIYRSDELGRAVTLDAVDPGSVPGGPAAVGTAPSPAASGDETGD